MTNTFRERKSLSVRDRLIVALDVPSLDAAAMIIDELKEHVGMFKIGLELYSSAGTALFDLVEARQIKVFFDGKFHDIPNTVAGAVRNTIRPGVAMLNVHATGGAAMMEAARQACRQAADGASLPLPTLIAVTVLTSIDEQALADQLSVSLPLAEQVTRLARLARESGLDGVVASAQEAQPIREACGDEFVIVTPGIRPRWSVEGDDQARVLAPGQALKNGADYLVVGRPILQAQNRSEAARRILEEMDEAL